MSQAQVDGAMSMLARQNPVLALEIKRNARTVAATVEVDGPGWLALLLDFAPLYLCFRLIDRYPLFLLFAKR